MEAETTNLPSPDADLPAPVETPKEAPKGIEEASEELVQEANAGTFARDPETGKFVSTKPKDPTDGVPPVTAALEPVVEPVEDPTESAEEAPKPRFVLKGMAERGEEDVELEVEDHGALERLNRLQNDGMRRKEYEKAMADVQTYRTERAEWDAAMQHNPLGTLLNAVPKEAQLAVAAALVAEHWDVLAPQLDAFKADPTMRYRTMLDSRETSHKASVQVEQAVRADREARDILTAASALVPETASDETKHRFLRDAEHDLVLLAQRGEPITKDNVKTLLSERVRLYGFAAQQETAKKPTPVVRVSPTAKPSVATTPEAAKAAQDRIKQQAIARKNAAAIPAGSKGAVIVRKPLVKPGASIEEMSEAILAAGVTSYADLGA